MPTMSRPLLYAFCGQLPYRQALLVQRHWQERVRQGDAADVMLLLEHPAVITLGRSASPSDVLLSAAELGSRQVEVVRVGRGGQVTYHGPGQLVGYPIRRVGRAIREHVQGIAQAVIACLGSVGIAAHWDERDPGVWTQRGKIAAVGIDARGGVTMHGFALNVAPRLEHYRWIVPCGSQRPVTSMAELISSAPRVEEVAEDLSARLAQAFGAVLTPVAARVLIEPAITSHGDGMLGEPTSGAEA